MLETLVKPVAPNMYRYDEFDAQFVGERVNQFAGQVEQLERALFEPPDALATLSDGEHRPLVFHCTAGKDRTGMVAAIEAIHHGHEFRLGRKLALP